MIYDSVLETIGNTPVVRLRTLHPSNGSEILVKCESANPGGSIKDRAALAVVEAAERNGDLLPGGTIIESTSGNFGKALAMIGATRGYRVVLVVDPKVPASTLAFSAAFGADIVMVSTPDSDGGFQRPRLRRVAQLLEEIPGAFWTDQYENVHNPRVHAEVTAQELLADVGEFDTLIAAVSTGGHISGLSQGLKGELPDLTTIAVDVAGSGIFGFDTHRYVMRGLGLAWRPGNLHMAHIDRVHRVTDDEGIATSQVLARSEALLLGESSGAVVFAALHHATTHPGSRVVAVAADSGVNYLTESFDNRWLIAHGVQIPPFTADDLVRRAGEPTYPPMTLRQPIPS